jgi:hypothetical protein
MNQKQVIVKLREILDRADIEPDGMINRKKSSQHSGELEVLLEHISLLVTDLRFEVAATRNELFQVRCILEE